MVNWTSRNKLWWNFNRNSFIFSQENPFENIVWKIASSLSRPQCVNESNGPVFAWCGAKTSPSTVKVTTGCDFIRTGTRGQTDRKAIKERPQGPQWPRFHGRFLSMTVTQPRSNTVSRSGEVAIVLRNEWIWLSHARWWGPLKGCDPYRRRWTGSSLKLWILDSLVQVRVCGIFSADPFYEPKPTFCQLQPSPQAQTFVKDQSKCKFSFKKSYLKLTAIRQLFGLKVWIDFNWFFFSCGVDYTQEPNTFLLYDNDQISFDNHLQSCIQHSFRLHSWGYIEHYIPKQLINGCSQHFHVSGENWDNRR